MKNTMLTVKKNEVVVGGVYLAKVNGIQVKVGIVRESATGGWIALNYETKQSVRIGNANRLTKIEGKGKV